MKENQISTLKRRARKIKNAIGLQLCIILFARPVYAAGQTDISKLTQTIATWTGYVGGIVTFIGVIQFAMGWRSDDPSEKIKGGKTAVAGIMVAAIAKAYTTWM